MNRNDGTWALGLHGLQRGMVAVTCAALMLSTPARSVAGMPQVTASAEQPDGADRARFREQFGKLPLHFIENRGQAAEPIAYYVKTPAQDVYFSRDGHALRFLQPQGEKIKAHTIRVDLVGADAKRVESLARAPGVVSYFTGAKKDWKTGIPTHTRIGYAQAWPGIDLAYDGAGGKLESIYTVAPHADPTQIKLRYSGQESLAVDEDGNLVYGTSVGAVKETAPIAWQDIGAQRVPVATRFELLDERTVGFEVAAYDRDRALVIDPTLVYAGYIGGAESDIGFDIAVDSQGNAYVTGETRSSESMNFPAFVGPDTTYNANYDAFVSKVSADGTTLLYSGYLGGGANDRGRGIAVDADGYAYVTGSTENTAGTFLEHLPFPVVGGPDTTHNGTGFDIDAFVTKLSPDGLGLVYSGFIGGSATDVGSDIAVDAAGNVYVTGQTRSSEASFPETQGPDLSFNGGDSDAFVAKVSASGGTLLYAGYIGGNAIDVMNDIAVDTAGNAYVAGQTTSTQASYPVAVGPVLTGGDTSNDGSTDFDAVVAKVSADGSALVYSGYISGGWRSNADGIAVDGAGHAYVTGTTLDDQTAFAVTVGPDLTYNGGFGNTNAFVAKLKLDGSGFDYAGYIGGNTGTTARGIAVDGAGNAYVTGYTQCTEATFPVTVGPDLTFNGSIFEDKGNTDDAFVAKVSASGSALVYAGYIGGWEYDAANAIAVDSTGSAYVTGTTGSNEETFPVLVGPDLTHNYDSSQSSTTNDAFVAKIAGGEVDTTPDPFDIHDYGTTGLNVFVSNYFVGGVQGINGPTPISVTGGVYRVGDGTPAGTGEWTSEPGLVSPGEWVSVGHTTSSSYSTVTTSVLTIGGVSDTFSSRTYDYDGTPDPFTCCSTWNNAPLNTVVGDYISTITVKGINGPTPISVAGGGGEYRLNHGLWTSADGHVNPDDYVNVRHTTSPMCGTEKQTVVTIGGVSATLISRTVDCDSTPDPFVFNDVVNVQASKLQTSNVVTITGIEAPVPISVTGGEYLIAGSGVWTTASGTISNGQQVQVRHRSAKAAGTTITTTLTVGGVSDSFSSTTKPKTGGRR